MWLIGRLMPDFKTIANFRKDNSKAIRGVCRQFVVLCQQLGLFVENLVAIDGSKFKAVNNRDRNFTSAKLKRRMEEIESSINRYLTALDTADRQEPTSSGAKTVRLEEKIAKLKVQMKELQAIEIRLKLFESSSFSGVSRDSSIFRLPRPASSFAIAMVSTGSASSVLLPRRTYTTLLLSLP